MSQLLNLPCSSGVLKSVNIIYNFEQVDDTIMLSLYSAKHKSRKTIFVDYKNGSWETNKISRYTDAKTYQQVSNKLKLIFLQHRQMHEENKNSFSLLPDHALLMLNACS